MGDLGIGLLLFGALMVACEAWNWRRRAYEWQRTAKATATLCENLIKLHAHDDDELLEARAELRRIRESVPS